MNLTNMIENTEEPTFTNVSINNDHNMITTSPKVSSTKPFDHVKSKVREYRENIRRQQQKSLMNRVDATQMVTYSEQNEERAILMYEKYKDLHLYETIEELKQDIQCKNDDNINLMMKIAKLEEKVDWFRIELSRYKTHPIANRFNSGINIQIDGTPGMHCININMTSPPVQEDSCEFFSESDTSDKSSISSSHFSTDVVEIPVLSMPEYNNNDINNINSAKKPKSRSIKKALINIFKCPSVSDNSTIDNQTYIELKNSSNETNKNNPIYRVRNGLGTNDVLLTPTTPRATRYNNLLHPSAIPQILINNTPVVLSENKNRKRNMFKKMKTKLFEPTTNIQANKPNKVFNENIDEVIKNMKKSLKTLEQMKIAANLDDVPTNI